MSDVYRDLTSVFNIAHSFEGRPLLGLKVSIIITTFTTISYIRLFQTCISRDVWWVVHVTEALHDDSDNSLSLGLPLSLKDGLSLKIKILHIHLFSIATRFL